MNYQSLNYCSTISSRDSSFPFIFQVSGTDVSYPIPPPSQGGIDSQSITLSLFSTYTSCFDASFNPTLAVAKLKNPTMSQTPAQTACLQQSIISKRFLQYQRIPPEIPPPLTLAEQIGLNAGRPFPPPGPCVRIVNLLQNLPI